MGVGSNPTSDTKPFICFYYFFFSFKNQLPEYSTTIRSYSRRITFTSGKERRDIIHRYAPYQFTSTLSRMHLSGLIFDKEIEIILKY